MSVHQKTFQLLYKRVFEKWQMAKKFHSNFSWVTVVLRMPPNPDHWLFISFLSQRRKTQIEFIKQIRARLLNKGKRGAHVSHLLNVHMYPPPLQERPKWPRWIGSARSNLKGSDLLFFYPGLMINDPINYGSLENSKSLTKLKLSLIALVL